MKSTPIRTKEQFLTLLSENLQSNKLIKLLLSKNRGDDKDLQRIVVRPILIREQPMLSFVLSYKTNDITKNQPFPLGLTTIKSYLEADFKAAHMYSTDQEIQLDISKKGKESIHIHAVTGSTSLVINQQHNKEKQRFVELSRPYLQALGVTDSEQRLIPSMSRKWKQINKFIEIFSQALATSPLSANEAMQVVDFGSGKGYLTFAIHDYLQHQLETNSQVSGVELRTELAKLCQQTAEQLEHKGLNFVCGDVKTHAPQHTDVMIALHACDVATDYAIHYGIRANAAIIMCSPCCHKQIRPQMHSPELLQPMLQFGVHLGQQAEMVTDSLRALLLEAHGYQTKVFEFVSLEHTNKNKMILAIKRQQVTDNSQILLQIENIKQFYGIKEHCLQTLLAE
jgi:hypothetical protein